MKEFPLHRRLKRRGRLGTIPLVLVVAMVMLVGMLTVPAQALTVGGFEIDADQTALPNGLYSGTETGTKGDDWAQGSANNGMFVPSTAAPHTAAANCYGSNVDRTAAATGAAAFICDGNSDTKFSNTFPELNIVSPSGKSPDDKFPIKPGNVRPKNDFSHAYAISAVGDSPCDADTANDDIFLRLAGHRGDNEGEAFWGFEFNRNRPTGFNDLKNNTGASFTLDMNRSVNDIFVSFTVPGGQSSEVALDLFQVTGFIASGSDAGDAIFTPASPVAGCPASQPRGQTRLATNDGHDIEAPPWNIPVCDPTADNSSPQCRLANGLTNSEDLIASRDFAEANIDLTAFGITNICATNMIFTSRSAKVLTGADVQDIGGGDFELCGTKRGQKFEDSNGDGDKDTGEPGVGGFTINLYADTNGDGVLSATEDDTVFATTTTGSDGNYSFPSLFPGTYIVCEVQQSGWTQSVPSTGPTCPGGTKGIAFTMTGADHNGNDFGNFRPGTVSGVKFKDVDDDGAARETGDTGLGGWEIHLFGTSNLGTAVHNHTTTSSAAATLGEYTLAGIPPGTYTVCETQQANWVQSHPTSGADCSTHTVGAGGATITPGPIGRSVTVTSNAGVSGANFGNSPLSNITVTFNPLVAGKTKATAISCVDKDGASVGSNTNNNTLTTNNVRVRQSSVVCTVTYVDP